MKKLLLILLCLPLLFTTCKKEEEEPNNNSGTIIGKWHLIEVDYNVTDGYFTNYPNGKTIVNVDSGNCILPGYVNYVEGGPMWLEYLTWDFSNTPSSGYGTNFKTMYEEWVRKLWGHQNYDTIPNFYHWYQNGNTPYVYYDDSLTFNSITNNLMIVTLQNFDTVFQNNKLNFKEIYSTAYFRK